MCNLISEESKYIVSEFNKNFSKYVNEPLVLYGIGKNTEILLNNIKNFNIVGLMDSESTGQIIYNKKVLSYSEAIKNTKKIIIIARKSVIKIIYERIKFLEDKGIEIYNIEGENLSVKNDEYNVEDYYYKGSAKELMKLIDKNDVISFDIFDTLIMRKVLKPSDIFDIVEKKLNKDYKINVRFKEIRIKAEQKLNKEIDAPSINIIYDEIQKILQCDDDTKLLMKDLEFKVECENIIPRKKMVEIYNYAKGKNKKIYFISDMYYSLKEIQYLLKLCGINKKENIIISSEVNKSKISGELYKYYLSLVDNGELLHIGDNEKSDIVMANKYGINTYLILSSYEMLVHSSYKSLLVNTETLEKRIILGLSISKLFNDPFILSENKGRYYANDLEVIGYSFVAPIIYGFMSWLIEKLDNDNYDVILFFARDGYLFEKIYKIMVEYSIKVNLPKGIYFNTSRRAITVANLDSEEEICFILKKAYKCTKKELLKQRFGIDIEDNDEQVVLSTDKNNNVKEFVLKYKDKIINNAKDEKREYLKYINNLDLKNNDKIAVFDLCSSGTIQFYLSKLINKKLHGYYFATMNVPNMFYTDYSQVESYLGNSNQYFSKYNFTKYHMLMESIFTSPKNTLIRCANNKFIYNTEETKKRNFNNISKIHNGIIEFIKDIIKNNSLMEKLDEQFLDNILGLFISNKTIVSERVKETFYTESCYDFSEEYNVWKSI